MANLRGIKFIVRPPARDYLVYGLGKLNLSPEEFFVAIKPLLSVLLTEAQEFGKGEVFEHETQKRAHVMDKLNALSREMAGDRKPKPIFNKLSEEKS